MWKYLNHPNIVPFKGVAFNPLQLVSERTPCKELKEYVKENHGANLIGLVSSFLPAHKHHLIPSSVARRCRRAELSSLVQRDPWKSQRGI